MIYKADQIVTTKDGRHHRVLWPVPGNKLRVKAHGMKSRGSYTIRIEDITP